MTDNSEKVKNQSERGGLIIFPFLFCLSLSGSTPYFFIKLKTFYGLDKSDMSGKMD